MYCLLFLLPLPFFLLHSTAFAQNPIHVELRSSIGARSIDYYAKQADRLRYRYGYATKNANATVDKRTTGSIPLINEYSDSTYVGTISVGTPPKTLTVVLDTGSSDLWVATNSCTTCAQTASHFDPSTSSTFQSIGSGHISYGSGSVSGAIAQDTVSIGNFTVTGQRLLAVDQVTGSLGYNSASSGTLGLAWPPLSVTTTVPFWIALVQSGQLTSIDMSFWLTREINDSIHTAQTFGGIFTLGGTNSSLYTGSIEFLPIQMPYWSLTMSNVTVNGQSINMQRGTAAIDTGTTLIGGPASEVDAIWALIPGSMPSTRFNGSYTFPCSTRVSVTISFGGTSWPINPVDINLGAETTGSTQCLGAIFSLGSRGVTAWVMGDTFLKNVYSVFRASPTPSVGFAQLS